LSKDEEDMAIMVKLVEEIGNNGVQPLIYRNEEPSLVLSAMLIAFGAAVYFANGRLERFLSDTGTRYIQTFIKLGYRAAQGREQPR
jgi:hypothetical protein